MTDESVLGTYYRALVTNIKSRVDLMNNLISHRGLKGSANEDLFKDILTSFLPRRYSIGGGIIFDGKGRTSKQIDVIIYDSFYQPEIFTNNFTYLFPVDVVYCVIEIKTLLTKDFLNDAINNINSVKELTYLTPSGLEGSQYKFELNSPYGTVFAYKGSQYKFELNSPYGTVFAYKGETTNFDTFHNWMKGNYNKSNVDKDNLFEKCYIFENTFSIKLPLENRQLLSIDFCPILENSNI